MKVQPAHLSAFESAAMIEFEARALAHLRGPLAEVTAALGDAELLARVRAVIPRAAQYGLKSEQEVIVFLDTSFLLGDEAFDRNPAYQWSDTLLNSTEYSPREKAALLIDRAFEVYQARHPKAT